MHIQVTPAERRTGGWLLLLGGLVHLLVPDVTVDIVRAAYAEGLDAAFIPRDGTNARVRVLGGLLLLVGLALVRGVGPADAGERQLY